jgi:radical SAM protein with 4Fe4S-binding SPASM domain
MEQHPTKVTSNNPPAARFDFTDSRNVSRLVSDKGDPNRIIAAEVGEAYWDYRRAWDLARGFVKRPPFPIQVDYELFYTCNLRCPICIMSLPREERLRWGDPARKLSLETVKRLLDEGAARGQAAVGLNGICEPLLSPDLPEIVRYARAAGMMDVMFNTNGLLLGEDISRDLIRAGLTRLMISLDAATEETYRQIRVGSDLEKVTENIKRFVRLRREMKARLPIVRVSYCVTSINEHELDDFIETWSPVVDFFSIQHYGNTFEGTYKRDRSRLFPQKHRHDPGETPRCAQPWKRVMVRHNGDVIPCCDASGLGLVIGNVYEQSLEDIWLGRAADRLRRMHKEGRYADHPICRQCMTKWGNEGGTEN